VNALERVTGWAFIGALIYSTPGVAPGDGQDWAQAVWSEAFLPEWRDLEQAWEAIVRAHLGRVSEGGEDFERALAGAEQRRTFAELAELADVERRCPVDFPPER
jgi:hypothetical protein